MKKIIAILLCLVLLFSFAACKKNKDTTDDSSTPSNPTQDYDKDEWEDGAGLTDDEREELEDLWNDLNSNGGAEVINPDSSNNSSDKNDNTTNKEPDKEPDKDSDKEPDKESDTKEDEDKTDIEDSSADIVFGVEGLW
ncbi:MAG: hypothetical protein J6Q74_01610 [Clostridia bacterium]|nr:hypothetical protein [Clostridia bacterium]